MLTNAKGSQPFPLHKMSQTIGAVVEDWIVEELDKIAIAENRTRSNVMENILKAALKKDIGEKDENMSTRTP